MLYVIDFLMLVIVYLAFFLRRWRRKGLKSFIIHTVMYVYICLVIMVTLMPFGIHDFIPGGNNLFLESANLIPYRDIRAGYGGAVRETILNIIMLMPFGFLLPFIKKRHIFHVLFLSFSLSLCIELTQLYFSWSGLATRSFDVTDLINNSIGGIVGYVIYLVFRSGISFLKRKIIVF